MSANRLAEARRNVFRERPAKYRCAAMVSLPWFESSCALKARNTDFPREGLSDMRQLPLHESSEYQSERFDLVSSKTSLKQILNPQSFAAARQLPRSRIRIVVDYGT